MLEVLFWVAAIGAAIVFFGAWVLGGESGVHSALDDSRPVGRLFGGLAIGALILLYIRGC